MYTVEIETDGPLFDGRWQPALEEFVTDAVDEVARQGLANWHTALDLSLRHPTGHYESMLTEELVTSEVAVVHDRGMVYGPWLEGTGSRNSPVTSFPGYAGARRATQQLESQVDRVLAPLVVNLVRHLNGA